MLQKLKQLHDEAFNLNKGLINNPGDYATTVAKMNDINNRLGLLSFKYPQHLMTNDALNTYNTLVNLLKKYLTELKLPEKETPPLPAQAQKTPPKKGLFRDFLGFFKKGKTGGRRVAGRRRRARK